MHVRAVIASPGPPISRKDVKQCARRRTEAPGAGFCDMMRRMSDGEERLLGVVEAITAVTRQCPHGSVVTVAEQALEAIKQRGADAMAEQAFLVLSAIQGWRGGVARQVHRSLRTFLDEHARRAHAPQQAAPDDRPRTTSSTGAKTEPNAEAKTASRP